MTQQTRPLTGTYILDPAATTIRCDCKALFGAMTVHGTFRLISGQLTIAPDPTHSAVSARIAADSYDSGHTGRDQDVKSKNLLDVRAFPEITFTSTAVQADGADWLVPGTVTAHGTPAPAEVRIRVVHATPDQISFEATATLDRTAFGITKMKGRVGRTVDLSIDAVAVSR